MADDKAGSWEANFRDRMIALRKVKGMTQTDLARELKTRFELPFHQQTVDRIEAGKRPVRLNEAHLIAEVLGVDLQAMTSGIGSPKSIRLNLQMALGGFAEQGEVISEYLVNLMENIEFGRQAVEDAWDAYVQGQEELGLEIDETLSADMRRFRTRYRRGMDAYSGLLELGDV